MITWSIPEPDVLSTRPMPGGQLKRRQGSTTTLADLVADGATTATQYFGNTFDKKQFVKAFSYCVEYFTLFLFAALSFNFFRRQDRLSSQSVFLANKSNELAEYTSHDEPSF